MKRKKAIVIGSGIGGSGVAALLQHSGLFEVDLFEKNGLVGGRFASHVKDGFRLDVGCHLIANCDKGTLGEILKILGRPDAVEWRYARRPSPVFNFKGERVRFPQEIHKLGFTGDELSGIMQFFAETNSIPDSEWNSQDRKNMLDRLESYVRNDRARIIFGILSGVYFVIPDFETPVGEWVRCNRDFMENRASGYPIGGTGAVPGAYVRLLRENGGRVHLATPVRRILVEDGRAVGVETRAGAVHRADLVISNAGLKPTVNALVGRDRYGLETLARVDRLEYSEATFMVKVALDVPFVQNENMVMFMGCDDQARLQRELEEGIIPEVASHAMIPIVSNLDPTAAPEGKQLIIIGGGANRQPLNSSREDWEKWRQAFLNALEIVFPGIREHILWTVATSPRDIDTLFGEDGCVVGIGQKVGQVGDQRPSLEDPSVRNLFHCSADTGLHGIGGELAADSALRLFRQLVSS
jgi:phytoene dehydrogenase-like protein